MGYSREEIERQLQAGEDSAWEFKEVRFSGAEPKSPKREDFAAEIIAFANADGGVLLCGATDDGQLQSMSREQIAALDALLVEVSTDIIKPAVRISTHHLKLAENQLVLVLDVPQGDSLHERRGESYIRVGGTKRMMTGDERLRLAQRRGQARFPSFDERIIPDTRFETLDRSLWMPLLSAEGRGAPEEALQKMTLMGVDDSGTLRATIAGVLLCAPTPEQWLPNAVISATRYRGRDRASGQIDAQEITGPLRQQVADAVGFAVKNMYVAARKEPARVDVPQYSKKALFEAFVNAVAHRDYSVRGSRIRLSMFEDRLEIQSPGGLPNNLTIESMATRQATRNEALASALGRMPVGGLQGGEDRLFLMERRGDGVPIIHRETRELSGSGPEYRLLDDTELCLVIPAASQELSPGRIVITAWSAGQPLPNVELLALFPNKTWKSATTDEHGEAAVDLHTTDLPMTVLAAARGYAAHLEREWTPRDRPLAVNLSPLPEGGGTIFREATGSLPGLKGRLNAVRDSLDRTYLYAANIAINAGETQPVHFAPGDELRLTDADGAELLARIVDIVGRSALLEYRRWPPGPDPRRGA